MKQTRMASYKLRLIPRIRARHLTSPLVLITVLLLNGCCSSNSLVERSPGRDDSSGVYWHLALKQPVFDRCSNQSRQSFVLTEPPQHIVVGSEGIIRFCVLCPSTGLPQSFVVNARDIDTLTHSGNDRTPPCTANPVEPVPTCTRVRDGLLAFDKVEFRVMGAYRGKQSAVFYPDDAGGKVWQPETFGFERGGTEFTIGGELALMWDVLSLSKSTELQLGVMGGAWPVDGSIFIPTALHPRITFNNRPEPHGCWCDLDNTCDTWYVFGDVGWVHGGSSGVYFYHEPFERRFFCGLGLGYEMALGRDVDLGIDIGWRLIHTPLPLTDCCPDVIRRDREPIRKTHNLLLRLGLTF